MFCHKRGNKLPEGSGFCNGCGAKLVAADTAPQPSETPSNPDEAVSPPTEVSQVSEDLNVTVQEAPEAQPVPAATAAASRRDTLLRFAKACRFIGSAIVVLMAAGALFGFMPVPPAIAILGGLLALVGEGIIEFYNRRFVKLTLTSVVVITILIIVVVALNNAGGNGATPTASVTSGNRYVQMVRNGSPMTWPNVTYDEAFSNFFGSPRWTHFVSDDGLQVVQFTGDMEYGGSPVNALIQFVVDMESGTFDATFLSFNEVPQTQLMLLTLINTVFDDSGEVQQREGIHATFGSTFVYLGLEYVIGDNWMFEDGGGWLPDTFRIPVSITNVSDAANGLQARLFAWCPNGLAIRGGFYGHLSFFGAPNTMQPGTSISTYIYFEYQTDGTYVVELSEWIVGIIDYITGVTITLPISRDGGVSQQPVPPTTDQGTAQIAHELVGRWRAIDAYNNWLFPDTGMVEFDIIEFLADGTGRENKDEAEFGFEWQATGEDSGSLVINCGDRELSVFYEIFGNQLFLMLEAGPPAVFNRMDVSAPPAANQGTGFIDHSFTLGRTTFVISTPPDWSYEIDWDGPGAIILARDVFGGQMAVIVEELWWADSWQEVTIQGNRLNEFVFDDGHTGVRITYHEDWGTVQTWAREDMWLRVLWLQEPDLLDYFDLITDIAASLRPR